MQPLKNIFKMFSVAATDTAAFRALFENFIPRGVGPERMALDLKQL